MRFAAGAALGAAEAKTQVYRNACIISQPLPRLKCSRRREASGIRWTR